MSALDNLRNGRKENLSRAFANPRFTFIEGDILDPSVCVEATTQIDTVFHLACLGVRHSLHSPVENHEVNARGSLNVLEAARKNSVRKVFYISTSEVYGRIEQFPIPEECVPRPITVYGASKLAGEHYAKAYNECFGMDTTVLRIFNNYGPRAHYEGDCGEVIPRTIVKILYDEQPVVFGKGDVTRDFFYVEDTADVLVLLLDKPDLAGQTYNLGTGEEITIRTLVETLLEEMGREELGIRYLPERPADVPRLWVDGSKIRQIVPLDNLVAFSDGLRRTVAFYRGLQSERDLVSEVSDVNWLG